MEVWLCLPPPRGHITGRQVLANIMNFASLNGAVIIENYKHERGIKQCKLRKDDRASDAIIALGGKKVQTLRWAILLR